MSLEFKGHDLTGRTFGRLLVVELSHKNEHNRPVWKCRCNCIEQTIKFVTSNHLTTGRTVSCGCYQKEVVRSISLERGSDNRLNMLGKMYGRLKIKRVDRVENTGTHFECECYCGNTTVVLGHNLTRGNTTSCGCLQREMSTTHGFRSHPLYGIWSGMKDRCYNPNSSSYHYYGGRGIRICNEWFNDFLSFYNWSMSHGYSSGLTIDRYPNNDGNYEPSNCRWTTMTEQARNTRANVVTGMKMANDIRSDSRPSSATAEAYGVSKSTVKAIRSGKSWKDGKDGKI